MIEDDRWCPEVVSQVTSATAALQKVAVGLLNDHLRHCVLGAAGSPETVPNTIYVRACKASLIDLGRGFAWLVTRTHDSLLEAGQSVLVLEHRQDIRVALDHRPAVGAAGCEQRDQRRHEQ